MRGGYGRGLGAGARARGDLLTAAVLGLAAFLLYLSTLAPTVLDRDSGRFQVRAFLLSIAHPTGYPTYTMLGKLFTLLPVGDVAYRVNLSSAVYGALAVALLYLVGRRLAGMAGALVGAAAFAVSRAYWRQALVAEVYTLNALLICAVLLSLLAWRDSRDGRLLGLAALLMGLSLTNHLTSGLLLPAGALFVLLTDRSLLRKPKLLAGAAALFLLGLTPYLYLPLRSLMDPPFRYADLSDPRALLYHVTGRQFSDRMGAFPLSELPDRLEVYRRGLFQQFSPPFLALAAIGLVAGWRRGVAAWAMLLALFVGQLGYALEYDIPDIGVYFIPTFLVASLWIAYGVDGLLALARRLGGEQRARLATAGVLIGLLALVGWTAVARYPVVDQSAAWGHRRLVERVARAPRKAVIYDKANTSPLQYLRLVERRRLDLLIRQVREGTVMAALEEDLGAGREVYMLGPYYRRTLESRRYELRPEGGLWRVVRAEPGTQPLGSPPAVYFRQGSLQARRVGRTDTPVCPVPATRGGREARYGGRSSSGCTRGPALRGLRHREVPGREVAPL